MDSRDERRNFSDVKYASSAKINVKRNGGGAPSDLKTFIKL